MRQIGKSPSSTAKRSRSVIDIDRQAALWARALAVNDACLDFTPRTFPSASIVVVCEDRPHRALTTLRSLLEADADSVCPIETVLVCDASDRDSHDFCSRLRGITVVNREKGSSYGAACNLGAGRAQGRYILFLDALTDVFPCAVSALIEAYSYFDNVGIVGPRLVLPDGTLQDAGLYFLNDEQLVHPYCYHHPDPDAPEAIFAREVCAVGYAALMIDRDQFDNLGGFDEGFAEARAQSADLCARCHQSGRRVVYQPRSTMLRWDGPTALESHGAFPQREDFLERHRDWLFESGTPTSGFMLRDCDEHRLRILYIDDYIPHFSKGAGLPRANCIINALARMGYFVTVYPVLASEESPEARYRDIASTIELLPADGHEGLAKIIAERCNYYDVLWVSRAHNINFVCRTFLESGVFLRDFIKTRIIFDMEALFASRDAAEHFTRGSDIIYADLVSNVIEETTFCALADVVACVSPSEREMLRSFADLSNVEILGYPVQLKCGALPFSQRRGFIFLGPLVDENSPNVDSIEWFVSQVWPRIRRRLGNDARFCIVGQLSDACRTRFQCEGVSILGALDKIDEIFGEVRVGVAPTRFSAGIPLKVYDSVSRGVPMVISPLLAAQSGLESGTGVLVASTREPDEFADAAVRLHEDYELWNCVREQGCAHMASNCDEQEFSLHLRDICEGVR